MELKQIDINNQGMSQDISISKISEQNYAFENWNIRIQATDNNTLVSITNIQGPKLLESNGVTISGTVIGKCITPDYLVLFTNDVNNTEAPDYIYKIDLNSLDKSQYSLFILFNGNLNFSSSSYLDTLYYEEGLKIKKVYWTDNIHNPRVINIATDEMYTSSDKFEFYPNIYSNETPDEIIIPQFNIVKNYEANSQLPAGTIQYFISYFYYNGAETLIANSSDTFTLDFYNRGGKADETGTCALEITIPAETINDKFDYFRIYSAKRTSKEGELIFNIVKDVQIEKNAQEGFVYTILDNGINQETLDASQLYFIGGTPFVAKTLTEKDNTIFFGNIKQNNILVPEKIENSLKPIKDLDEVIDNENAIPNWAEAKNIKFNFKEIDQSENQFNSYYKYKLQTSQGSSSYKTFKSGEIYRFGIQFQNELGQWTDVIWIGDKECVNRPEYDAKTQTLKLNDVTFTLDDENVQTLLKAAGYVNYRICIADPENSNGRKIKAQGLLCPTLFTPGQRALNSPYGLPSWIMRPRKGKQAYHHFEPMFEGGVEGAEIASYSFVDFNSSVTASYSYPFSFNLESKSGLASKNLLEAPCYLVSVLRLSPGHQLQIRSVKVWSYNVANNFWGADGKFDGEYEVVCDYCIDTDSWSHALDWSSISSPTINDEIEVTKRLTSIDNYYTRANLDTRLLPSSDELRKVASAIGWREAGLITLECIGAIAAIVLSIVGVAFGGWVSAVFYVLALIGGSVGTAVGIPIGVGLSNKYRFDASIIDSSPIIPQSQLNFIFGDKISELKGWQLQMLRKGYIQIYEKSNSEQYSNGIIFTSEQNVYTQSGYDLTTIPDVFKPKSTETGNWYNSIGFIQLREIRSSKINEEIKNEYNNFYVDESIVTLHSPEITEETQETQNSYKTRVVGYTELTSNYSNYELDLTEQILSNSGLVYDRIAKHKVSDGVIQPIYSDYLYADGSWQIDTVDKNTIERLGTNIAHYKAFLFSSDNLLGIYNDSDLQNLIPGYVKSGNHPCTIKTQKTYNFLYGGFTNYLKLQPNENEAGDICYNDSKPISIRNESSNSVITFDNSQYLFNNNYDTFIVKDKAPYYYTNLQDEVQQHFAPISTRIKFNTTPCAIIPLYKKPNYRYLLPSFKNSKDYYRTAADAKPKVYSYGFEFDNNHNGIPALDDYQHVIINGRGEWFQDALFGKYGTGAITKKPETYTPEGGSPITYYVSKEVEHKYPIWDCWTRDEDIYVEDCYFDILQVEKTPRVDVDVIIKNGITDYIKNNASNLVFLDYLLIPNKNNENEIVENSYKPNVKFGIILTSGTAPNITFDYYKHSLTEITTYFDIDITTNAYIEEDVQTLIEKGNFTIKVDSLNECDDELYIRQRNYRGNRIKFKVNENNKGVELYYDFAIKYETKLINDKEEPTNPYLFIGEIYKDIPYESLYGGNGDSDLRKLNWIPISKTVPVTQTEVANMEGDTYYQRWDCLKTYPTTEEDVNQVVDITSFMVETHKNLDERTDVNRTNFNIMSRPTNFNLFNDVYDFKNDLFTYQTKWNDLTSKENSTHITWSLTKNNLADVDSWTNVSLSNIVAGKYPVTKLLKYNNTVMSFTEHSVDVVIFNARVLSQMQDGQFLELANSNKVDGVYNVLSYGTFNMSMIITERGIYFIDDNEKSLIRYNPNNKDESLTKISLLKHLDHWFHNNVVQGTFTAVNNSPFHLEYDNVHKDLYIINDKYCLVYNETIESFISFIEFEDTYTLFNQKGKTYSFANNNVYEMFAGEYNKNYNDYIGYSVEYRITPNAYSDKVFTNINLIADTNTDSSGIRPNKNQSKDLCPPFDSIRVWNEYQDTTEVPLKLINGYASNLKAKYRTWRLNIPRDKNLLGGDRIRNPWIFVKLKKDKDNVEDKQFTLHSMVLQYME